MHNVLASTSLPAVAASALATTMTATTLQPQQQPQARMPRVLRQLFDRIRHSLVPFNAQDVYAVCTTAYHSDTIGLMLDADVMRGLADAFVRVDQTVLTPFQVNLVSDTLRKAGVYTPAAVAPVVPSDVDAITPESLFDVLRAMNVTRTRDERTMEAVVKHYNRLLDDAAPSQLVGVVCELARLRSRAADFMARAAARALAGNNNNNDNNNNNSSSTTELSVSDVTQLARALAQTPGVPSHVLRRAFVAVEARVSELLVEDYGEVLLGLQACGVPYRATFAKLVVAGLAQVESMDAVTLVRFLCTFARMDYSPRSHVEIYADALVDVACDLAEDDLVYAFLALHRLQLLSEELFATMAACLLRCANSLKVCYVAPVMDVCSRVAHDSSELMGRLLVRVSDCYRFFSAMQLADVLAVLTSYPPARGHPLVSLLGKQAHLRLDMMTTDGVAQSVRALVTLGYADAAYYQDAAATAFRYGFRSWAALEPVMMGLCASLPCSVAVCKVVASHVSPMARTMSLPEVQRANHYLRTLQCEEDYVYRALATRVQQFVKEVTPELPDDLQALLQRGAVVQPVQ